MTNILLLLRGQEWETALQIMHELAYRRLIVFLSLTIRPPTRMRRAMRRCRGAEVLAQGVRGVNPSTSTANLASIHPTSIPQEILLRGP